MSSILIISILLKQELVDEKKYGTIRLSHATISRLKGRFQTFNDTYEDIVTRLIDESEATDVGLDLVKDRKIRSY